MSVMRYRFIGAVGLALAAPSAAMAGPWTAPKGQTYNKAAVNYFVSEDTFGDGSPGFERFTDINFTNYLEHGITDDLTFIAQIPIKRLANTTNGVTIRNTGVGDVDIGLRYNFIDGPVVLSTQVLFKAPYLYDEDADLPLGNGQEDVEIRLQIGKYLGKLGYVAAETGYRYRAEDPVDEFRYLVEYGFNFSESTFFRTKLDGTLGIQDVEAGVNVQTGNPNLPLQFNLGRLEYTVGYRFDDVFSAEVTGTSNVYGDNTLQGNAIQFALVAQF